MTLKDNIDNLISQNDAALAFIKSTYSAGADEALLMYAEYLQQPSNCSIVCLPFAHTLQFASDPVLADQFEPKDVERLYDSFLTLSNLYLNAFADAASFLHHTSSSKEKAKDILKTGIHKFRMQLADLEEMLKDMDSGAWI